MKEQSCILPAFMSRTDDTPKRIPDTGGMFKETNAHKYIASVQFDDKKANTEDSNRSELLIADEWLQENDHIRHDEYAVGVSMSIRENNISQKDPVKVKFTVSSLQGYSYIPEMMFATGDMMKVRKVEVEMSIVEFWDLFRSLEITVLGGFEANSGVS